MGYIKPPGAKTYDDWQKDDAATPIYREWFRRLKALLLLAEELDANYRAAARVPLIAIGLSQYTGICGI